LKCRYTPGLLLLSVLSFSAAGQSAKDFNSFGWGAYSHSFTDILCTFRNEAGLAGIKYFSAAMLAERRFMLDATSSYAFAAAVPASSGTFCLSGDSFGFDDFRRLQVGLAYGRHLAPWLDAGIQFYYLNMRVPAYGSAWAATFSIAAMIHWNEHWHTGFRTFNPIEVKYNGLGNDAVPAAYQAGIGYQPSSVFLLSAEISETSHWPLSGTVAFYYHIAPSLGFTGGIGTGEEKLFLGLALYLKQFRMMFYASYYSRLGISPAAAFIFENNKLP
jgi:hypothetical protein